MFSKRMRSKIAPIVFTAIAAMAMLGSACGDDGGTDDGVSDPTAEVTTAAANPTADAGSTPGPAGFSTIVAARAGDLGTILTTFDGYTLYVFANDVASSGTSACEGGCASAWPPLTFAGEPNAGEGVTGELGEVTRSDGTAQLSYNGMPLYLFASDAAPGDTNGKDVPNWSVAKP